MDSERRRRSGKLSFGIGGKRAVGGGVGPPFPFELGNLGAGVAVMRH